MGRSAFAGSVVLVVDDDQAVLDTMARAVARLNHQPVAESDPAHVLEACERARPDVVLLDLVLPGVTGFDLVDSLCGLDLGVIVLTGHGDVPTAVEAMQRGALNFLTKPVELAHLDAALDRSLELVRLKREVRRMRRQTMPHDPSTMLGVSPDMVAIAEQIDLLAQHDRTTVLLTGESGTGKGVVARLIHERSPRSGGPFIDINCAGLTATFLDSELFGYERGAFTDAKTRKPGLLEKAAGGTLLLDEIGELGAEIQPKLLKVLEDKTFRRMGGTEEIAVDVRLIAATNQNLKADVATGAFREDLFYRLSVLPLHLPPVRDRAREDRLSLLESILGSFDGARVPEIDGPALDRLLAYSWPGNVREMRNVIERAMILSKGASRLGLSDLPAEIRGGRRAADQRRQSMTLADVERRHILRTLQYRKGNRTQSAKELGISRATLINKIKRYQLEREEHDDEQSE